MMPCMSLQTQHNMQLLQGEQLIAASINLTQKSSAINVCKAPSCVGNAAKSSGVWAQTKVPSTTGTIK